MALTNPTGAKPLIDITGLPIENGKFLGWNNNKISNLTPSSEDLRTIVSATKPTTRANGSALQILDEWIPTSPTLLTYYRVYGDWYSRPDYINLINYDITNRTADATLPTSVVTHTPLVVEKFIVSGTRTGNNHTSTAFWNFGLQASKFDNTGNLIIVDSTVALAPTTLSNPIGGVYPNNTQFYSSYDLPSAILVANLSRLQIFLDERAGSVGVQNLSAWVQGRWKAP